MKKIIVPLLSSLVLSKTYAQYKKQMLLKWAPGRLAAGKITVGGEYNFKKKSSIECFIGLPAPVNHQFKYDNNSSDLSSKAFSVLAGYRYYFGKKNASGIYVEPYAKYLHHQASGFLQGELNGEVAKFDTKSDYKGFGIGAQLGIQFLIAKRFSLDLFILGPEANSSDFSTVATDVASNIPWTMIQADEAENDIKNAFRNIPIVGDKIEVSVNQSTKTVTTRYSGFLPGVRFGASVGIRL